MSAPGAEEDEPDFDLGLLKKKKKKKKVMVALDGEEEAAPAPVAAAEPAPGVLALGNEFVAAVYYFQRARTNWPSSCWLAGSEGCHARTPQS